MKYEIIFTAMYWQENSVLNVSVTQTRRKTFLMLHEYFHHGKKIQTPLWLIYLIHT